MKFKEMNLPNKLTTIRMVCVPIVILLFLFYMINVHGFLSCDVVLFNYSEGYLTLLQLLMFVFFTGASITDFIDGHIARSRNLISDYGKLMDPLADKLLVNSTLVMVMVSGFFSITTLTVFQLILIVLVVFSLARDIFVDALRMQALKKNVVVPANIWGKVKTATLMPGVAILLLGTLHVSIEIAGLVLIGLGSIFSIIGGVKYFNYLKQYIEE